MRIVNLGGKDDVYGSYARLQRFLRDDGVEYCWGSNKSGNEIDTFGKIRHVLLAVVARGVLELNTVQIADAELLYETRMLAILINELSSASHDAYR